MMTVTGGEGLTDKLKKLNFMPVIKSEVIRTIRKDSAAGLGADGVEFAPYTNAYKQWRIHRGLSASPVNLRVKSEGSLLDNFAVQDIDKTNSIITVKSDKEKQAQGLSKKRKFMGVSQNAITQIEQKLEPEFVRAIS